MIFRRYRLFSPLKEPSVFIFLVLFLSLGAVSSVLAQEDFVTYPPLPSGYSSIRVFDNHGRFVGRIMPDKRFWIGIDRIPAFLQKAVVAVEDSRFYEHGGIDVRGIARALVKDVTKGKLVEGGSTITQQLIKNKFLSGEKTLDRKLKEARLAIEYERKYSKRQILEMYFNEIYYGNGAWGIAQAARLYFDKNPEELTEAECSILAGVPKNPSRYNPRGKPSSVTGRRDVVLQRMVELKLISRNQQKYLRTHPPSVVPPDQAPWYLALIRKELIEHYGEKIIATGGLDLTASLDLDLQKLAQQVLRDGVRRISSKLQGALLCLDTETGDVLAAVGGVDFAKGPYDRAFSARRQPGSTIKPLIYAAALDIGITAASIWDDAPVAYDRGDNKSWMPLNYGKEQYGKLSLRQALAYSNNIITVKLLDTIGVPYFVDFASRMGLSLRPDNGLSLALGTGEATLKDMVLAYTPLANGGSRPEARTIIRIYERNRHTFTETPPAAVPVLSPATAFVTTRMLMDVMQYGTARVLRKFSFEHPSAGKTGTTDDYRDAWFIGYTPRLITGVWVGYDKPRSLGKGFTGGAVAAPIWARFMDSALTVRPSADFPKPDKVVSKIIDPATGYLAKTGCPKKMEEYFIDGTEPTEYCPEHPGEPIPPVTSPPSNPGASEDHSDNPNPIPGR